jgi:hypothetical protein
VGVASKPPYGEVGGRTAKFRQPAGGLARGGAGDDRATTGGREGFTSKLYGLRVLSPTERARFRFSLVRSPRAHPGGPGLAWARRMDLGPNPGENEEPGARLGRIPPSGCKKRPPGAKSGGRLEMLLLEEISAGPGWSVAELATERNRLL